MTTLSSLRSGAILLAIIIIGTVALAATIDKAPSPGDLARGDCQVGNPADPIGEPVPGIFEGDETYAYHIFPADQCACTEEGFAVESISQLVNFHADQVPANLVVTGYLLEAIWDPGQGCWLPGPVLEASLPQTFTIDMPDTYLFTVPMPTNNGYLLNADYFLALQYEGGAMGQLVVDDQPLPCTEYINRGAGWEDLFFRGKSGGGKLILWGDVVCSVPVGADATTWGAIKSLYR